MNEKGLDSMYSLANVLNQKAVHILVWEEDGVFIAKCWDIPGCISEGPTREQALANIHDAIGLCLDVIREDSARENAADKVEMIEQPLSDFLDEAR